VGRDDLELKLRYAGNLLASTPGPTEAVTQPSPEEANRFPGFDGLRAIAVLMIVAVQTAFYAGSTARSSFGRYIGRLEVGLFAFFLISGFLLYRPFAVSHLSNRPAPGVGRFYLRRLLRIMPAYWVALTLIVYVLHGVSIGPGWHALLAHYTLTQIYFPRHAFHGIVQSWSLCTVMSFYLLLPVYGAVLAFGPRPRRRQLANELSGIAVLIATSIAFRAWALNQPIKCLPNCLARPSLLVVMNLWLPAYLDLFAMGMLLAVVSAWFDLRRGQPRWLAHRLVPWISWTAAAVVFWAVSNLGIPATPISATSPGLNILKQSLYGVFAFLLLVPAVLGPPQQGLIRRLLQWKPLAMLGVISYGVYLWHLAWVTEVIKWAGHGPFHVRFSIMFGAVLALSVGSAAVSYLAIERPILELRDAKLDIGLAVWRDQTASLGRTWTKGRAAIQAWIERNEAGYDDGDGQPPPPDRPDGVAAATLNP
jgi:peptidoglycan/LPS O-acetylase OafA/YrhL